MEFKQERGSLQLAASKVILGCWKKPMEVFWQAQLIILYEPRAFQMHNFLFFYKATVVTCVNKQNYSSNKTEDLPSGWRLNTEHC